MSGAGAALIATPLFVLLGFPLQAVITSNCINGAVWTPLAARNYLREQTSDLYLVFGLILFGLLGAFFGTLSVLKLEESVLKMLIGGIIIALAVIMLLQKQLGLDESPPRLGRFTTSTLALPLGFYEAFFGAGNGIFTSLSLTFARGFNLLHALGTYYMLAFFWCVLAAVIYLSHGLWLPSLMIPAAIGSLAGGYLGSRIGRTKGTKFVRKWFIALGLVLGLQLCVSGWLAV